MLREAEQKTAAMLGRIMVGAGALLVEGEYRVGHMKVCDADTTLTKLTADEFTKLLALVSLSAKRLRERESILFDMELDLVRKDGWVYAYRGLPIILAADLPVMEDAAFATAVESVKQKMKPTPADKELFAQYTKNLLAVQRPTFVSPIVQHASKRVRKYIREITEGIQKENI